MNAPLFPGLVGFVPFKDRRAPVAGEAVRTYRNLTTNMVAIQAKVEGTWTVIGSCRSISLQDVQFQVSAKSAARARVKKARDVHAFAVGIFSPHGTLLPANLVTRRVSYNPFKGDSFYLSASMEAVHSASSAIVTVDQGGCVLIP